MSEISKWFEETFKECYCENDNLIDQDKFRKLVQLILDGEADEKSKALFEEKIKSCVQSNGCYKDELSMQDAIREKLLADKAIIPVGLANSIRKSLMS